MENDSIDFILGSIVGLFAWFFGGLDGFLSVLITCIIIDWVLGTLNRLINNKFCAKEFWSVWGRKIGELCFVGIAHLLDKYMFGDTATFRTAVTLFYIIVEGKSIIGHATGLGLPVPKFVETRLLELEDKLNKDDKITRGESIKKAIDSEIFREPEKAEHQNDDFSTIYENIYKDKEQ